LFHHRRDADEFPEDLLVFYDPETLQEICALKKYLLKRKAVATVDAVDEWIRMIALNRLTGHSPGFFPCTPCRRTRRCA